MPMCDGYPRIQTAPFVLVASGTVVFGNALHAARKVVAIVRPLEPWSAGWPVTVFGNTARLASWRSPGLTVDVKFPGMPINRSLNSAVLLLPSVMDEILTGPRYFPVSVVPSVRTPV